MTQTLNKYYIIILKVLRTLVNSSSIPANFLITDSTAGKKKTHSQDSITQHKNTKNYTSKECD